MTNTERVSEENNYRTAPEALNDQSLIHNMAPPRYIEILKAELKNRSFRNGQYSLRAFARDLDMHASALSRILSGHQKLTIQNLLKIIDLLKISNHLKQEFRDSFFQEKCLELKELVKASDSLTNFNSMM